MSHFQAYFSSVLCHVHTRCGLVSRSFCIGVSAPHASLTLAVLAKQTFVLCVMFLFSARCIVRVFNYFCQTHFCVGMFPEDCFLRPKQLLATAFLDCQCCLLKCSLPCFSLQFSMLFLLKHLLVVVLRAFYFTVLPSSKHCIHPTSHCLQFVGGV